MQPGLCCICYLPVAAFGGRQSDLMNNVLDSRTILFQFQTVIIKYVRYAEDCGDYSPPSPLGAILDWEEFTICLML
ncbi:hypothetical protein CEXT_587211 [Caerostris extrusa]|uniref:Uncharacterized protein n=1 Tax=Caerostris extrusa TaxID=172846 RepID=A0AAV4RIB8_CAEEX|nr:hypothetical protein CEXT_587211 [Caerostris extrusa]